MKMTWLNIMMLSFMMMILLNLMINLLNFTNKFIHPIIIITILLCLSILNSVNMELFYSMNWISYLMFLIIIGGMMIIFLYFISFINNNKINIKWNVLLLNLFKMIIFFLLLISIFYNYYKFYFWNNSLEILSENNFNIKIKTMYMYMYNKNYIIIMNLIYLLIMLMFVVKMCINKKMTLRKIN